MPTRRTRYAMHCGHLIEQYGYDDADPTIYIDGELTEYSFYGAKLWCEEYPREWDGDERGDE